MHTPRLAPTPLACFFAGALTVFTSLLSGCGAAHIATTADPGVALNGHIFGGQQPIVGASIALYAAGLAGTGAGATSLLTTPVFSGVNGGFTITDGYTCPSPNAQVYLIARGGNPGLPGTVSNDASVLMAALGNCSNLTPASFVTINEVTTVASAWALAQFSGATTGLFGASSTNATGLANAFLIANNLVDTTTGRAGGPTLPTGATLEPSKLYTLADILAVCVNSDGGAACTPLFAAATENGVTPTNTLDAALAIVHNPGRNVAAVFDANNAQSPFQPTLANAPNDWTMSLEYTGGGLYAPTAVALDSTGSIWAADYFGGHATKLSVAGVPASPTGFADSHLYESYGLAIDAQDSAWITVEEDSGVNSNDGAITKFSSTGTLLSGNGFYGGGVFFPYAIAADPNGNMWVANNGNSTATLLANDGSALSPAAGYQPAGLSFPTAVALDNVHNAWFGVQGSTVAVAPSGAASLYSCCRGPEGVALDPLANVWISDYTASSIVEVTPAGAVAQRLVGGGLHSPQGIATDGAGNVWAVNFHGNTFTGYTAVSATNPTSTPISPSTGFGVDAVLGQPFGIAADASGNIWLANFANNSLTQFVGLAAPTKTPRLGLATAP